MSDPTSLTVYLVLKDLCRRVGVFVVDVRLLVDMLLAKNRTLYLRLNVRLIKLPSNRLTEPFSVNAICTFYD